MGSLQYLHINYRYLPRLWQECHVDSLPQNLEPSHEQHKLLGLYSLWWMLLLNLFVPKIDTPTKEKLYPTQSLFTLFSTESIHLSHCKSKHHVQPNLKIQSLTLNIKIAVDYYLAFCLPGPFICCSSKANIGRFGNYETLWNISRDQWTMVMNTTMNKILVLIE